MGFAGWSKVGLAKGRNIGLFCKDKNLHKNLSKNNINY
jgi:hypothetical protein